MSCDLFLKETATTEIYTYGHTLSLHDALPISQRLELRGNTAALAEQRDAQGFQGIGSLRRCDVGQGLRGQRFDIAHVCSNPICAAIRIVGAHLGATGFTGEAGRAQVRSCDTATGAVKTKKGEGLENGRAHV